ncbi:MAG TPA: hypothetical protein VFZ64_05635 [Nocardioidaceae bacterium]
MGVEAVRSLAFGVESRSRPFHLVSPGFVGVRRAALGEVDSVSASDYTPAAPFTAIELGVVAAESATVVLGLSAGAAEHVLGFYDRARGRVGVEVRSDGVTAVVAERSAPRRPVRRLAFVLCENKVTVLGDVGEGWRPLVSERRKTADLLDLRRPENLGRFTSTWGVRDGTATLGEVSAGLFGMAGIRDLHLVQHSDGRPYVRDGRMFVTATCAGLGFFQQAHWGVFSFDPEHVEDLHQVSHLFSVRDGMVLGDHAGQLVRDDEADRWIVATSSWGDFTPERGVHVRHAVTHDDLLGGTHLLRTERSPLPTDLSTWDPGLTKVGGRWYVSFVESPSQDPFDFHPALAVAEEGAEWTAGLTMAGAASDLHHCEGPVLAKVDGEWWLLTSDGEARTYPVFDLRMRRVGDLDAPYGSNIPHPQIVQVGDGVWKLLTFDGSQFAPKRLGYGTHGDVVVMSTSAARASGRARTGVRLPDRFGSRLRSRVSRMIRRQ